MSKVNVVKKDSDFMESPWDTEKDILSGISVEFLCKMHGVNLIEQIPEKPKLRDILPRSLAVLFKNVMKDKG